jgi:hypothetical protein
MEDTHRSQAAAVFGKNMHAEPLHEFLARDPLDALATGLVVLVPERNMRAIVAQRTVV